MAELPRVEMQNAAQALRDAKVATAAAVKETDAARAILERIEGIERQCAFYERGIDASRGRIVLLLMAHLRHAEAGLADEYIAKVEEALVLLSEKNKADEAKNDPKGPA